MTTLWASNVVFFIEIVLVTEMARSLYFPAERMEAEHITSGKNTTTWSDLGMCEQIDQCNSPYKSTFTESMSSRDVPLSRDQKK